ncbi:MAG: hypothetical protein N2C14_11680, partial [Planctomycetales bacterium]
MNVSFIPPTTGDALLYRRFRLAVCILLLSPAFSSARLVLDVTGVPGSGVTLWSFGNIAPIFASNDGTVRDVTSATFNVDDSWQIDTNNVILNPTHSDIVYPLTGLATITIGGDTNIPIAGIFLDDDGVVGDDIGIRVGVGDSFSYLMGESTTWTGSGTIPVDINDFVSSPVP